MFDGLPTWDQLFSLGVPTVLLLIIFYMVGRAAVWIGNQFLLPISASIVAFLNRLQESLVKIEKTLDTMSEDSVQRDFEHESLSREHQEIKDGIADLRAKLEKTA